jgi:glucosamine kinase
LLAHEGIIQPSTLTRRLLRRFGNDPASLLPWARQATPSQWGEVSPLVFACADAGDEIARTLVAGAARDVSRLLDRMVELGAERIALVGGLADAYAKRLPRRLARRLAQPQRDALAGAIDLARQAAGC